MRIYKQCYRGKEHLKWTVELRDHMGIVRKFAGHTNKAATEELARRLGKLVDFRATRRVLDADLVAWLECCPPKLAARLAELGLVDKEASAGMKPLAIMKRHSPKFSSCSVLDVTGGHLSDYRCHMKARELAPRHILQVISHCAKLIADRKLAFPADMNANTIENHIASLRECGASARTANAALAAIKSFCG